VVVSTTTRVAFRYLFLLDPRRMSIPVMSGRLRSSKISMGLALVGRARLAVAAEQIVDRSCTVGERHDVVVDAGAADVSLDQTGVSLVVLDHDDGNWLAHVSLFRLLAVHAIGSVIVKVLPLFSSDCTDMVPPRRRTRARTWANPIPWPGLSWVPARRNRSKIR